MRQQVEDCLERLRTDLGGWLALLTHDSGTVVAWTGPGDPAAMAHYCQASADRDADLTHLLMRECDWPSQARTVRVVSHPALPAASDPPKSTGWSAPASAAASRSTGSTPTPSATCAPTWC